MTTPDTCRRSALGTLLGAPLALAAAGASVPSTSAAAEAATTAAAEAIHGFVKVEIEKVVEDL